MGPQVVLVSSAEETAFEVRGILSETGLGRRRTVSNGNSTGTLNAGSNGSHRWISSGEAGTFVRVGQHLFGPELDEADHWDPPVTGRPGRGPEALQSEEMRSEEMLNW
ncbi:MAG TPA: hypothetical protein VMS00_06545 [Acidimicrobiales bacterium]|nr:hypothetical protein [Acidimicrobiales bacterium]